MPAAVTTDVERAAAVLRGGGLVAFATETVYGLGANALDERAVAGIFEAKGRPHFDPLIVHLADVADLGRVAAVVPDRVRPLIDAFWPGPLTLVLPKRPEIPDLVTSGLDTVGVRVPDHPLARELIRRAGCPVAAPSANLFGRVSPTTAEHVMDQLGDRIDLVLDGGPCRVGVESTVIQVDGETLTLLRPGGVTLEDLTAIAGPIQRASISPASKSVAGPGMLPEHYAPLAPVVIVTDWSAVPADPTAAALGFRSVPDRERFGTVEVLSPDGSLREAAARFFAALRRLDATHPARIYAEAFPNEGLGLALNDRLTRAACRTQREDRG